jgi:thymidylate kinase
MKINSLLLFSFLATSVLSFEKNDEKELTSSSENGVSFVVIADMHSMSKFAFQGDNPSIANQRQWEKLTDIMENIRNNYINDTEALLLAPGDLVSFGQTSNEDIQKKSGIEDENEAVYFASAESYKKANELYSGFSTLLPSIGDHELGGESEKFIFDHIKLFFFLIHFLFVCSVRK